MSILNEKMYYLQTEGNNTIIYIFDNVLKTKVFTNNPNQGFKIGLIENYTIEKDEILNHLELYNLINFNSLTFNLTQPEKWFQIILHKTKIYPHSDTISVSGFRYEETLDGKTRKDIAYKHFFNGKYSIPAIIETKDINNKTSETINEQINSYIEEDLKKENIKPEKNLITLEIIVNSKELFFDLYSLNILKFLLYSKNNYISQNKKTFKYIDTENKYTCDSENSEAVGIFTTIKFKQKIDKTIYSNSKKKSKKDVEYRIEPSELHNLSNFLNPRNLLKKDSFRYFANILSDINSSEVKNANEDYDVNNYGNEKIITSLEEPLELSGNVLIGVMSLSDGQRSSYSNTLCAKLFNQGVNGYEFTQEEKDEVEKIIKNLSWWNTNSNKNIENFLVDVINPIKDKIFDTTFATKTTINVSNNKDLGSRKATAHNTHAEVVELDYLDFQNVIFLLNKELFEKRIMIDWPHLNVPEGFEVLNIETFFQILYISSKPESPITNRSMVVNATKNTLLKDFKSANEHRLILEDKIKSNISQIKDKFDDADQKYDSKLSNISLLSTTVQNKIQAFLDENKLLNNQLENLPLYVGIEDELSKPQRKKLNTYIDLIERVVGEKRNNNCTIDEAMVKIGLVEMFADKKQDNERDSRIDIISSIHNNISTYKQQLGLPNVQTLLNPGFADVYVSIIKYIINNDLKTNQNISDILNEMKDLIKHLFEINTNISAFNKSTGIDKKNKLDIKPKDLFDKVLKSKEKITSTSNNPILHKTLIGSFRCTECNKTNNIDFSYPIIGQKCGC